MLATHKVSLSVIENQTAVSLMVPLPGNTVVRTHLPAVNCRYSSRRLCFKTNSGHGIPWPLCTSERSLIDVIITGMIDDLYLNALN